MATHSSVLAWRIPGTVEPGGLLSMGSHRVRHDWSDLAAAAAALRTCICQAHCLQKVLNKLSLWNKDHDAPAVGDQVLETSRVSGSMCSSPYAPWWRATPWLWPPTPHDCDLPQHGPLNFRFLGSPVRYKAVKASGNGFPAYQTSTHKATWKNFLHETHPSSVGQGILSSVVGRRHDYKRKAFLQSPRSPWWTNYLILRGHSTVYWLKLSALRSNTFRQLLSKGICNCF